MSARLTPLLAKDAVPLATLRARYGPLLELVRKLIGVIPNCDGYLEIWPPAFRSYNVMVPNFLNLPLSVWGIGLSPATLGLALYVSSRTAACGYCSAHTCSFAMRRGAKRETVARALDPDDPGRTSAERAVIAVARSLARIPSDITAAESAELGRHFSSAHVEWLVLGVAMMGFLNKFMDALGVELEEQTVDETAALMAPSGWTIGKHGAHVARAGAGAPPADDAWTKLGVVPFIPAALSFDKKWTGDAPARASDARAYLRERTGHDFPVLAALTHGRAIRAITVMLRDNLDPETSRIGVDTKIRAGAVYARVTGDAALARDVAALAAHHGLVPGDEGPASVARSLAEAISTSPAVLDDALVEACRALAPSAIVELVAWVGVLQMLHRVTAFYGEA
jgi:alkylhydroperoxidase family enzyme